MAGKMTGLTGSLQICKLPVSLLAGITAAAGHSMFAGGLTAGTAAVAAAVFLLSCGAGGLNHFQDRELDRSWSRTSARPIPSGRISPGHAMVQSVTLITAGLLLLAVSFRSIYPVVSAAGALACYNGVYAPMKRRTPFALIPGSLSGMLAAQTGWMAAGGLIPDYGLMLFMAILFIWQIPHFWVISLSMREDFNRAPLPVLLTRIGERSLRLLAFLWVMAYASMTLFLAIFGLVDGSAGSMLLAANFLLLLVISTLMLLRPGDRGTYRSLRFQLGSSQLLVTLLVIIGA